MFLLQIWDKKPPKRIWLSWPCTVAKQQSGAEHWVTSILWRFGWLINVFWDDDWGTALKVLPQNRRSIQMVHVCCNDIAEVVSSSLWRSWLHLPAYSMLLIAHLARMAGWKGAGVNADFKWENSRTLQVHLAFWFVQCFDASLWVLKSKSFSEKKRLGGDK